MSCEADELAAAKRAAEVGDGAALLELAQPGRDRDEKVQTNGARALGGFRDERAIERLRSMLADTGPRYTAIESLCRIGGDAAAEALGAGLGLTDVRLRARSAEALGEVGGERARALLVPALQDDAREVRAEAVRALGRIGGEGAVEALERALADDYWQVRTRALDALSAIGGAPAREALERRLARVRERRWRWVLRRRIRKLRG